jgi:hypothetical protein
MKRKRKLATFPGQCVSAPAKESMATATLIDAYHFEIVTGDHLSLVGWVNSHRMSLHGHDGLLIISGGLMMYS